jgi:hypothetical protein
MDLRSSELEMECISEDHIAAAIDDIIPEIPMDIADLTALTQAATETIVKILVSHNPRLRPRYDRFDVSVAFRPCSDMEFDLNEYCIVSISSDAEHLTQNYHELSRSCPCPEQLRGRDIAVASDSSISNKCSASHGCYKDSTFNIVDSPTLRQCTGARKLNESFKLPPKRLLERLFGCLSTSCAAD